MNLTRALIVAFCPLLLFISACQSTVESQPEPLATQSSTPNFSAGTLLKGSGPAIYRLMVNGTVRQINDWSTFIALGYETEVVETVPEAMLATYPLAPPLTRWLMADSILYYVQDGQRHRASTIETMEVLGGNLVEVSLVSPSFLENIPLADEPLPALEPSLDEQNHPRVTAAAWVDGFLWVANETGLLTGWMIEAGQYQTYNLPESPIIQSIFGVKQTLYLGTKNGQIWELRGNEAPQLNTDQFHSLTALTQDHEGHLWAADINHLNRATGHYQVGQGLVQIAAGQVREVSLPQTGFMLHDDPLKHVMALAFAPQTKTLWIGTRFAGVFSYALETNSWQQFHTFNSPLRENRINDLTVAPDGAIWVATPTGAASYQHNRWENHPLAEGVSEKGALSIAVTNAGVVWVAGDSYIAWLTPGQAWQVYTAIEQSLLADQFQFVILDGADQPWFLGRRRKINVDGDTWRAYGVDVRQSSAFTLESRPSTDALPPPLDFPDPTVDYEAWLKTWPRPENDNGRGMHFVQRHWLDEIEAQQQINRLQHLGVRWTVVNYANHYQLRRLAPLFAQAGIMVVWRPFVRPYERYEQWAEDIAYLRSQGLAPYMQLYNEPSLAQEWEDLQPIDQEVYLQQLLPAIRQVYDAGGYVGLQFLDPEWLQLTLHALKRQGLADTFDRFFFIPHPYGLNHPPAYDEDINSVLGFQFFAKIFEEELGFVPMMIAGEGGWRPGEAQDNRYPAVSEAMHRDYHVAIFGWFQSGQLSNGQPLPDYLFAFCPWLISDPTDPAAWFDSDDGDRTLTIEAVVEMETFERQFSWESNGP